MKRFFLSIVLCFVAIAATQAQSALKVPALSPNTKISQEFSISSIELSYGRPSLRGRKVFGDLVPYGKAWRTGANAPTKLKTGEELEIEGVKIKAGEYLVYSIPGKDKWEIVISSATGNWTAEGFPREFDVARFKIKPLYTEAQTQTFNIQITDITFTTCKIEITWEHTKVVIPVVARNQDAIATSIDNSVNKPNIPYFQAANYYYETNQKMDVAAVYVDKAIDANPKAYYMWYLKARIEKKLGHTEEALMAARKSIELASETPAALEYKNNNEKIINELNRKKRGEQPAD